MPFMYSAKGILPTFKKQADEYFRKKNLSQKKIVLLWCSTKLINVVSQTICNDSNTKLENYLVFILLIPSTNILAQFTFQ